MGSVEFMGLVALNGLNYTRTCRRHLFPFSGLGFPCFPLKTKKGTLFIPRLLPGLVQGLQDL